jgi:transposase
MGCHVARGNWRVLIFLNDKKLTKLNPFSETANPKNDKCHSYDVTWWSRGILIFLSFLIDFFSDSILQISRYTIYQIPKKKEKMVFTKRLTIEERKQIEELTLKGLNCEKISLIIGRGASTIKDEFRKNGDRLNYNAVEAQKRADLRHENRYSKQRKINELDEILIIDSFQKGYSINKICQEMRVTHKPIEKVLQKHGLKSGFLRDIVTEKFQVIEEHIKLIYELIEEIRNDPKNK